VDVTENNEELKSKKEDEQRNLEEELIKQ